MKKVLNYLLIIATILTFKINVFAFDREYNVQDFTDTLSEKQLRKLRDKAEDYYDEYGLEMMIYIYNEGYSDYELKMKCKYYWDDEYPNSYGACLGLDIANAINDDYVVNISTSNKYYSDSELDSIFNDLRSVKYEGTYAICDQFADSVSEYSDEEKSYFPHFMLIILPFVISGITIWILISKNKMVRKATTAQAYLNKEEINITRKEDRFVTTHITRVPINTSSSGGGSRGGGFGGTSSRGGHL